ncbi:hypothetical protein ACROYT_G010010 [Oculina patagonica]
MSNGQEVVILVQEEHAVIGEAGVTSKTLMAATDEGVTAVQIKTVEASGHPQPSPPWRLEAWPAHPPIAAPTIPEPSHHVTVDVDDVPKNRCSVCLKDFCCLYDDNYEWYELKGKGVWCVLFLLLGYLIFGVLALAAVIVACYCALLYNKVKQNIGSTIEIMNSLKILGVQIDNKLSFKEHISVVLKKLFACKRLRNLQSIRHLLHLIFGNGIIDVDDSFCIIKKNGVTAFHDTLNSIDTNIAFTIEYECNGNISFLDTLVLRNNEAISVDVHRKLTHTDRYLDFNSHHDKKHKVSTAATILHRALNLNLPNTSQGKERELNHVYVALEPNGYPSKFIRDIQIKKTQPSPNLPPEELVGMFFNLVKPPESRKSFVSLPYIKGVTEPLTCVLKKKKPRYFGHKQADDHFTTTVPCPEVSSCSGFTN